MILREWHPGDEGFRGGWMWVYDDRERLIITVDTSESNDNLNLVLAALKLLAACKLVQAALEKTWVDGFDCMGAKAAVDAAIAAAKGEADATSTGD